MRSTSSLFVRSLVAILLMLGFYLLAAVIIGVLVYVGFAGFELESGTNWLLGLACLVLAWMVLRAVLPRIDRFQPPGPQVDKAGNPELYALVRGVAEAAGKTPPEEIYLMAPPNAWVARRGGWMGLGAHRIMGVGLPYLQTLSVSDLRGVIAHEYGHECAGDVGLSGWFYVTRAAIGRAIGDGDSWIGRPFLWYGRMFMRVTLAISRRQELAADRFAARLVGQGAVARGLERTQLAGLAWDRYWDLALAPALENGCVPPILEGFESFLASPGNHDALDDALVAVRNAPPDPIDTHPALADRLRAIEGIGQTEPADERPAAALLGDVRGLELELLEWMRTVPDPAVLEPDASDPAVLEPDASDPAVLEPDASDSAVLVPEASASNAPASDASVSPPAAEPLPPFERIEWDEIAERVWVPYWSRTVDELPELVEGVTCSDWPELIRDRATLLNSLLPYNLDGDEEMLVAYAAHVATCALAMALVRNGWTLAPVWEGIELRKLGSHIRPFEAAIEIASGALAVADWSEMCRDAGIADLSLEPPQDEHGAVLEVD